MQNPCTEELLLCDSHTKPDCVIVRQADGCLAQECFTRQAGDCVAADEDFQPIPRGIEYSTHTQFRSSFACQDGCSCRTEDVVDTAYVSRGKEDNFGLTTRFVTESFRDAAGICQFRVTTDTTDRQCRG